MYDWDCGREKDDEKDLYRLRGERKKIFYSHNEIGANKDFPVVLVSIFSKVLILTQYV